MTRRPILGAAVALWGALIALPAAAGVEVQQISAEGGRIVLTLVNRPETSAQVRVRVGNQTMTVPVSGLEPGAPRTVVTNLELPCGPSQRVEAAVLGAGGGSVSANLSHPCGGANGESDPAPTAGGSSPTSGGAELVELSGLRVNRQNGLLQTDLKYLRPVPGGTRLTLLFSYAGETEEVTVGGLPVNYKKTLNSTRPFPCNATEDVKVEITEPFQFAGVHLRERLQRSCVGGQGTPNLVPASLVRTRAPLTNAIAETAVEVRVVVENDSNFNMADNEMGGTAWAISVTGMNGRETVRRALLRNEEHSFKTTISVPCWTQSEDRYHEVTVRVDANNNILESNERDNEASYTIEKNRCRDSG